MAISYRTGTGAMNLNSRGRIARFQTRASATASARTIKKAVGGGRIVY